MRHWNRVFILFLLTAFTLPLAQTAFAGESSDMESSAPATTHKKTHKKKKKKTAQSSKHKKKKKKKTASASKKSTHRPAEPKETPAYEPAPGSTQGAAPGGSEPLPPPATGEAPQQ